MARPPRTPHKLLLVLVAWYYLRAPQSSLLLHHTLRRRARRARTAAKRKINRERRAQWFADERPIPRRGVGLLYDVSVLLDPTAFPPDANYSAMIKDFFRRTFRLTWDAFLYVHAAVEPDLRSNAPARLTTGSLRFWNSREKLLIALYYYATGATYSQVAQAFRGGLSEKQVQRFVEATTLAIVGRLASTHVRSPHTAADFREIAVEMQRWSGMPHCAGIVDGSHISVCPRPENQRAYKNRKGWYSIILHALTDAVGRFRVVDIGRAESEFGEWCAEGGVPDPYYFLGDAAYPFFPWLQKGYPRVTSFNNPAKKAYNEKFSQTRWVVEASFGKLKGQWRCLYVGLRARDSDLWEKTVLACVVLHNITIDKCGQGLKPRRSRPHAAPGDGVFARDPDDVGNENDRTTPPPRAIARRDWLRRHLVGE